MKPEPERRQGYEKLAGALTDIAVFKEKFIAIEKKLNTIDQRIISYANDVNTKYKSINEALARHELIDEAVHADVIELKNKEVVKKELFLFAGKAGKALLFGAIFLTLAVSKGFDAAIKYFIGS